jgi:GAF domain-containing protein
VKVTSCWSAEPALRQTTLGRPKEFQLPRWTEPGQAEILNGWDESPSSALLVPIASQAQDTPAGILVAALNPYRQLDASYSGFLNLIAGQIAGSLANARAYEQERKRAESLIKLASLDGISR